MTSVDVGPRGCCGAAGLVGRRMGVGVACLVFLIILQRTSAQPGFVSLGCCATKNFTDSNIIWTRDDYFLKDVGRCKNFNESSLPLTYQSARIFGTNDLINGSACYKLPVMRGQDYLVRTTFLNGTILRSMNGTSFNISIGATSISRVNSSVDFVEVESIFSASSDQTSICLLRGDGNAYVSMVELRPLNHLTYKDASYILKLITRVDLGNVNTSYRYPVDPADRIWSIYGNSNNWILRKSPNVLPRGVASSIPIEVLQTAAEDANQLKLFVPDLEVDQADYLVKLYFLELEASVQRGGRIIDINMNGEEKYGRFDILDNGTNYKELSINVTARGNLDITLVKNPELEASIYGPICNAYEIFQVHKIAAGTAQSDVDAAGKLRDELTKANPGNQLLREWNGNPCVPSPWAGFSCKNENDSLVITKLNLTGQGLQGPLPEDISELTKLEELDLDSNNFSGTIPESFASLHHLSKLSIRCNPQFNNQHNLTNFTIETGRCAPEDRIRILESIFIFCGVAVGSVAFTAALGMVFACFYRRVRRPKKIDYPAIKNAASSKDSTAVPYVKPVVQQFSLRYIEVATWYYKTKIGEGGFGIVYRGTLPHGQEVAVKVRSSTSSQGIREFDNELKLLSSIRHENLVPLLGYCCDNDQQILVYPFMSNGSLQDRLYGEATKRKVLDWPTRLSIALGAARGILYLHNFAGRCIIHRDIKSSNILLDHSMCAKVADFGFSKYAPQEGDSGASLEVRGTAGYLDPEYYSTQQLSTKSDVFSFGVVLLEIITGKEPLNIQGPRNEWSLIEWAKEFIRESRIEEIVDPTIIGGYHAEAMWRVVETAIACIQPLSAYRPSMDDVVRELEDSLIIENNASEYMKSINESITGGLSNRFLHIDGMMVPQISSPAQPSPSYGNIMPTPLPR